MVFNSTFTTMGLGMGDMYVLQTEKTSVVHVKNRVLVYGRISSLRSPAVMVHWNIFLKSAIMFR